MIFIVTNLSLPFNMEDFNSYTRFLDSLNTYVGKTHRNVLDLLKHVCDDYTYKTINQEIELFTNDLINRKHPQLSEKIEELVSTPVTSIRCRYKNYYVSKKLYTSEIDKMLTNVPVEYSDYEISGIFKNGEFIQGSMDCMYNVERLEGTFQCNKLVKGKMTKVNEDVLEGEFVNGKLNGQGKLSRQNGYVYEGEFVNNVLNGYGKIYINNGDVYEGWLRDNRAYGQGCFKFSKGGFIEGIFKDNRLEGIGKTVYYDGTLLEGTFKDGKLEGMGKIAFPEGMRQEGVFKEGKLNGEGKITFSNGDIHEGLFVNNVINGRGKITFGNGMIKEGVFKDSKLEGRGKMTLCDGNVWEGAFENDMPVWDSYLG